MTDCFHGYSQQFVQNILWLFCRNNGELVVRDGVAATILRQRAALTTGTWLWLHFHHCAGVLPFSLLRVLWGTCLVVGDKQLLEIEFWSFQ